MKLHYKEIPSGPFNENPSKPVARFKKPPGLRRFTYRFGNWFYSLVFSLLPTLIIFFIFTEPADDFNILALFHDKAIIYVCVTMSALSLYICGRLNLIAYVLIIIMTVGTTVYIATTLGIEPSVFVKFNQGEFVAWFFLLTVVLGLLTIVYSSVRSVKKGVIK